MLSEFNWAILYTESSLQRNQQPFSCVFALKLKNDVIAHHTKHYKARLSVLNIPLII